MFGGINLTDTKEARAQFLAQGRRARGLSVSSTAKRIGINPFDLKRAEDGNADLGGEIMARAQELFRIGDYWTFATRLFHLRIKNKIAPSSEPSGNLAPVVTISRFKSNKNTVLRN